MQPYLLTIFVTPTVHRMLCVDLLPLPATCKLQQTPVWAEVQMPLRPGGGAEDGGLRVKFTTISITLANPSNCMPVTTAVRLFSAPPQTQLMHVNLMIVMAKASTCRVGHGCWP